MKKRHLQLPLALALALGASGAHALGLGPIQVKSGLNEPLVAEIPILSAAPGELDELEVRLASPEAFARVGLERPVGLTANLQMSVGRNAAGQPVIRVTTASRFTEPFLTFLIEANWGRGSVVNPAHPGGVVDVAELVDVGGSGRDPLLEDGHLRRSRPSPSCS